MGNKLSRKTRIMNWFGARQDDINFLLRKDVSVRFKILNILSGDRLRSFLVFPALELADARRTYDDLPEIKAIFEGENLEDHYEHLIYRIMWFVDRAYDDLHDMWTM